MLSNFFRHADPFDLLSSRVDDIFADFEDDRLTRPPQGFFDDFGFGLEDDLWGHRHPRHTNRRRIGQERGYGGYRRPNDDLRSLVFSMQRQMQDMQRMFDHIEDRLYNPALEDRRGAPQPQKQQQQQHLTHPENSSNQATTTASQSSHRLHSESGPNQATNTGPTQDQQPWYKIVRQEKHYIGGSDPSKRSYFVKTEVNDNGHVRVKTAEKKPGEDWHVDTKEYEEPSQRALKREPAQPQGQLKASHPEGEQPQSQSQPQIKEDKEAGSEKISQH